MFDLASRVAGANAANRQVWRRCYDTLPAQHRKHRRPPDPSNADPVSHRFFRRYLLLRPDLLANRQPGLGKRFALVLGAGLVMAALAAAAGLTDVLGDDQIRNLRDAWLHAGGNVLMGIVAARP